MRLAFCVLLLAGCASTSDVVSTGPDTYLVTAHGSPGVSSGGAQKVKAIREAESYCKSKGKTYQVLKAEDQASGFGRAASAEVEFRCV